MGFDFWSEHFWLPEKVSWDDLRSNETVRYPQFGELRYSILAGLALLLIRLSVECLVFLPLGILTGWVDTHKASYATRVRAHIGFCVKSKFKRVSETAWRFTFYSVALLCGVLVLRHEPQFYDVDECWRNWPYHPLRDAVWWYYIVETGFYWSLLISTFIFDVRRSDFWQMMIHHAVTILLLSLSFTVNFVRVGALILFIHDSADVLIELGKLFRYAGWKTPLNLTFVAFFLTWIATRLVYYPFWIIQSVLIKAPALIQADYRWENLLQRPVVPRVFVAMLITLLLLHLFWTYLIAKIALRSAAKGDEVEDIRESESDSSEYDEDFGSAAKENGVVKQNGTGDHHVANGKDAHQNGKENGYVADKKRQ